MSSQEPPAALTPAREAPPGGTRRLARGHTSTLERLPARCAALPSNLTTLRHTRARLPPSLARLRRRLGRLPRSLTRRVVMGREALRQPPSAAGEACEGRRQPREGGAVCVRGAWGVVRGLRRRQRGCSRAFSAASPGSPSPLGAARCRPSVLADALKHHVQLVGDAIERVGQGIGRDDDLVAIALAAGVGELV